MNGEPTTVYVGEQKYVFPPEMSTEQIRNVMRAKFPTSPASGEAPGSPTLSQPAPAQQPASIQEDIGWLDRVGSSLGRLQTDFQDTLAEQTGQANYERALMGEPTQRTPGTLESGLRNTGTLASGIAAPMGDLIAEGFSEADQLTGGLLSDSANAFINSPMGKAVGKLFAAGGEQWDKYKQKNPQDAETIEAAAEVGLLAMDTPVARARGAAQMLAPDNLIAKGGKTTESKILRRRKYHPDDRETRVAQEAASVPGWDNARSKTKNHEYVEREVERRARKLDYDLQRAGGTVDKAALRAEMGELVENFSTMDEAIILQGSETAQRTAERILREAERLIDNSDGTPFGILQARRELDSWLAKNVDASNLDYDRLNARSVSMKLIRDKLNSTVEAAVPDVAVRDSLAGQHRLLEARDILNDKMVMEGLNPLSRIINGITHGHVGPVGAWAILSGVGKMVPGGEALAGAATGGLGLYAAFRALSKPQRRQAVAVGMQYYQQLLAEDPNNNDLKREYEVLKDMAE